MFLSTFASMGIRRLKATSMEANKVLRCPLLLLAPLFSSCCRENGTKEKLHFTGNVLVALLRETGGQSLKSPLFLGGSFEVTMCSPDKRVLIISDNSPPPRGVCLLSCHRVRAHVCACVISVCTWAAVSVCIWLVRFWQNVFLLPDCTQSLSTCLQMKIVQFWMKPSHFL